MKQEIVQRSVFFHRKKFRGHSHTQNRKKCFFPGKVVKNTFFFPEKVYEPLTQKNFSPLIFLKRKSCLTCFFFPPLFWYNFCSFLFLKSLQPLTHSVEKAFFFRHRKKSCFFTHSHDFGQKSPKTNF